MKETKYNGRPVLKVKKAAPKASVKVIETPGKTARLRKTAYEYNQLSKQTARSKTLGNSMAKTMSRAMGSRPSAGGRGGVRLSAGGRGGVRLSATRLK
jgi:hypothetical protein